MKNPASTPEQRLEAANQYVTKNRRLLEPGLSQAEQGDFVRLRELAATYTLPGNWAAKLRARGGNITLSGRNIWLSTKYTGTDPESNENGRSGGASIDDNFLVNTDGFGLPLQRRVALIINLNY